MQRRPALIQLTVGAVIISFAPVWVKLAPVGPTAAAFYRTAIGAITLLGFAVVLYGVRRPDRRQVGLAALAGVLFALDLIFWHRSIHYVGPGLSTILGNFQVFLLAGFGVAVLKEPAGWRLAVAIPLAVIGLVLLVGVDWSALDHTYRLGVIFGLLTAVTYAGYLLVLRASQARAGRLDPVTNLGLICATATAVLAGSTVLEGQTLAIPDVGTGLILLGYGITAQVIAWLLISRGLPGVPASRAGLLLLLQPALAFVWDMVLFARPTSATDLAGATLALGAIYLGTMAPRE